MVYSVDQKIEVIERQIVSLKKVWSDRIKRREEFALHHLSVLKSIAEDLRRDSGKASPTAHP